VTGARGKWVGVRRGRWVEGNGPTPGLLVVRGVWAGSDSPVERWGAVSEGAGNKVGVGTARVPAPSESLEVVQGQGGSANREGVRRAILVGEGRLWRESFAFNARICVGGCTVVFVRVIFGVGVFGAWWGSFGGARGGKDFG
jgi:hypothetical protein